MLERVFVVLVVAANVCWQRWEGIGPAAWPICLAFLEFQLQGGEVDGLTGNGLTATGQRVTG